MTVADSPRAATTVPATVTPPAVPHPAVTLLRQSHALEELLEDLLLVSQDWDQRALRLLAAAANHLHETAPLLRRLAADIAVRHPD